MKRKLIDISGKVDPVTIDICESIVEFSRTEDVGIFLVGASARDMILHHGYGIEARRATGDVDFAVQVSNWNQFNQLTDYLKDVKKYKPTKTAHRLIHPEDMPIDIVPFGSIVNKNGQISWPPGHTTIMNVMGFDDVYNSTDTVRLQSEPELDVPIASLPGIAALKLFAWQDRNYLYKKHALDLEFIARNYLDAGNNERLHDEHQYLLTDDFDYVQAGARLLGRDIMAIFSAPAKEKLQEIINNETGEQKQYQLAEDMTVTREVANYEENLLLLESIKKGLQDTLHHAS